MERVAEMAGEMVRPGGHVLLFCTIEQHSLWKKVFERVRMSRQERLSANITTRSEQAFTCTNEPYLAIYKPQHYLHANRSSATLLTGTQYIFHCKRNGVPHEREKEMVNWQPFNYVQSRYPACKHIIDNVPRLAPGEQVRVANQAFDAEAQVPKARRTKALRNEQKCLPLLRELISRFSQPGDIVVDFFSGTLSTALACLTLPEVHVFAGTELDADCHAAAVPEVCKRFAVHISMGNNVNIPMSHEIRSALRFLCTSFRQSTRQAGDVAWEAPADMPQYQALLRCVVASIASTSNNPSWVTEFVSMPVHRWPAIMQSRLHQMDEDSLLQLDAGCNQVFIAKSGVQHPAAGRGCFAANTFHPGELIGFYYGALVYTDLSTRPQKTKEYGEGVLAATSESFRMNAIQIRKAGRARGFDGVGELVSGQMALFIVPPKFCSMRYINDARYLNNDAQAQLEKTTAKRLANARFEQHPAEVTRPKDLEAVSLIQVRATRVINPGDELFLDYGTDYMLFKDNVYCGGE